MISPEQVFLIVEPVDMRWGIERLSQQVQSLLHRSPCDGTAYGFTNRARSRLKLLLWDGTGAWLCQRRLHRGHFYWPKPGGDRFIMSAEHRQWLTTGVDWQRLCAKPQARIDKLYLCEEQARDMNTEARAEHRALHSLPQL